jgi:outer membrane protein assembly factor BamB
MNTSSSGPLAPGPDCERFAALLPLLSADELTDERAAEVRAHVAACRWCQQRLKEYAALDTALRRQIASLSAEFPMIAPESVIQMVDGQETLPAPPAPGAPVFRRPRSIRRVVTWMAPLAAVLAIVVLVTAIFAARGNSSPGGPLSPALYVFDSGHIVALRPSDGALLWRSGATGVGAVGSTAATPVSDGDRVYGLQLGDNGVSIVALRASDGTTAWQSSPINSLNPTLAAANGVVYFSNSTYHNGQSITHPAPAILAFRGSDGHLLWQHTFTAQDQIMSAPVVANGKIYIGVGASLAVLRASDGALLWRIASNLHGLSTQEQMTVTADSVYLLIEEPATPSPNPQPLGDTDAHLAALGANSMSERWLDDFGPEIAVSASVVAAPVVANGVVYIGLECCAAPIDQSGSVVLYALRATDGSQLWRYQVPPAEFSLGDLVSGPVLANGALYVSTSDGYVSAMRQSDHALLWQRQPDVQGQQFFTGSTKILAATDQALFVETNFGILAMRTSDGATIWQYRAG